MTSERHTQTEMMIVAASRLLEDGKTVFVGTGMPMLATMLAKSAQAPGLAMIYEAGGFSPLPYKTLPISVGDSISFYKAIMAASLDYVMTLAQAGFGEYGMLGGAQIDIHGNLNTTVIGSHDKPKVRLPGSGGANDFGSLCWKTIILMKQDRQKFVKTLDFLTTPGYLSGGRSREEAGLPRSTGPWRVVTQLGMYGFNKEGEMMLLSRLPGVEKSDILENSEFHIDTSQETDQIHEPSEIEIQRLRALDPYGIVLGK